MKKLNDEIDKKGVKEIERLNKIISKAITAINNHLIHPWEFLSVRTIKRMLEGED